MVNNGIITAPINMKDPYTCMGVGAAANGYDLGYICSNRHNKTNKWSWHKPVIYGTQEDISFDTDLTRRDGLMWGMRPPKMKATHIHFNTICFGVLSGNTEYPNWEYKPPVPGRDWSRLTDFIGYNHNAQEPFTTGITNYREEVNLFDLETINFFFMMNQGSDFTMSEFMGPFTEYHFVVELYVEENGPFYSMGKPTYRFVSKNAIKDMSGWSEDITVNIAGQLDTSKILDSTVRVCMGMQNIQSGNPEAGTGMVAPWKDRSDPPCFKTLRFVSYFNRRFEVTAYNFGYVSGGTWYPTDSYQEFSFRGTRPMCFRCRMERKEKGLYILPEHSSYNPPGARTMFVRGKVTGDYSSEQYAKPSNASAQTTQYVYVEPSSKEGEYTEFYLLFDSLLKIGRINHVVFESSVDGGKTWAIMNMVYVNITCTN